jgi:hypothetical protein
MLTGGASAGFGQSQSTAAKPDAVKPAAPAEVKAGSYLVHQSLEVGGRITSVTGSQSMWDTLVNQGSGGRILGQSLDMHSTDTHKTPFFDSLSTFSNGYGGDPYNVTHLKMSKGRFYDFAGSFRRDRNYFDYNLLDNSLLTTGTATAPPLVTENDSLHLFNTVRRNLDTELTLFPISFISYRAGYTHGTHEGPTYSSIHNGGDVQVLNYFRNAEDTYTAGIDVKPAKRTTISYDQFLVYYKGDSNFSLAGANYTLSNGAPVSLGVDVLGGNTTCGSATAKPVSTLGPEVSASGVVNPYCTGTLVQSQTAPTRTSFPTEQVRFSSHFFDKIAFNGRFLYSGATSTVNSFNETFNGLGRGNVRQTIETGSGANGQFANNKRIRSDGDVGLVAELSKIFSVSDSVIVWNTRTEGYSNNTTQTWTGVAGSAATKTAPAVPTTSMLTPLSDPSITVTNVAAIATGNLDEKVAQNTVLATAAIGSQVKVSGGWRYKNREISDPHATNLTWTENGAIAGAVIQPSRMVRLNVNFDSMSSKFDSGTAVLAETTPSTTLLSANTFTRTAPDKSYHFRARALIKPAKWIDFAITGNDYSAKNDDPQVNHTEHNHDLSFAANYTPVEGFTFNFNFAHDDVFSQTDLCYIFVATTTTNPPVSLPSGALGSTGTCLKTATNPEGTLTTAAASSQLYLGHGTYDAPSNFFAGAIDWSPSKYFRLNAGARLNAVSGSAEMLNPLMVPGALQSRYYTPFADLLVNVASQWAWHGNWIHNEYDERGPLGSLAPRNVKGDTLTLGVKYAF